MTMRKTGSRTSEEESLSKSGSDRTSGNGDFMEVAESDAKGECRADPPENCYLNVTKLTKT